MPAMMCSQRNIMLRKSKRWASIGGATFQVQGSGFKVHCAAEFLPRIPRSLGHREHRAPTQRQQEAASCALDFMRTDKCAKANLGAKPKDSLCELCVGALCPLWQLH